MKFVSKLFCIKPSKKSLFGSIGICRAGMGEINQGDNPQSLIKIDASRGRPYQFLIKIEDP